MLEYLHLLMLKNERPKSMGKVLSIFEHILCFGAFPWFRDILIEELISEFNQAVQKQAAFEVTWLLYFTCRHEIEIDLKRLYSDLRKAGKTKFDLGTCPIMQNPFVSTLHGKSGITNPFGEDLGDISLFTPPNSLSTTYLVEYLDVFDREKE